MKSPAIFLASVAMAAIAVPAYAQDDHRDGVKAADIVVTGSRLIKNGDDSPTPITVITNDDLRTVQPTTVADGLNLLPAFSSPRNQYGNPNAGLQGGAGGNAAANQLNLRNLGSVRNLVLFDGHRVPSTSVNNIVDVDMIPQLLLQRVETVTGGVSAVYGSDAVTGVVNFIIDRKFTGLKAHAQAGISTYGDGGQVNLGAAYGVNIGDRGHFEASYEYRKDEGVSARSERSFLNQWAIQGAGTAANPFQLYNNVRIANQPFGGRITNGALAGQYFAANGVLSPFVNGTSTGTACCQSGGAGGYFDSSLRAPLESHQAFARFDYEIADGVNFYAMGIYNEKKNSQFVTPPTLNNVTISATNAFLSPAIKSQLATAGASTFTFSKIFNQADRLNPQPTSRQYWVNTGLEGKTGAFDWKMAYSHAESRISLLINNNPNNQKLAAALDAVTDASGRVVCRASLTNAAYSDCVPLNVFGPTSASAAAIDYILDETHMKTKTTLDDVTASIAGTLFDGWAGSVDAAISGEWRRTGYSQTSDALPTDRANCTGLLYNCAASTTVYNTTFAIRTPVHDEVKEVAAEINIPLLKDSAIGRALNLNAAGRFTSYRSSGDYWTWKVGVDWELVDRLRFRGTVSRDIRAPTLDDLYAPTSVGFLTNRDELTGLTPGISAGTSAVPGYAGGNPDLKAEIGHTVTAGLVWKPTNRLSFAIDGYRIKISNAISNVQGFNPTVQHACYASGGTSPYCMLQVRPNGYTDTSAANLVTAWYSTVINIAEIETRGIDFEANYRAELGGRPLMLRALASYQPDIIYRTPALVTIDQAGSAFATNGLQASPKWRVTAFLRYAPTDSFTIDIMERWRSAMTHSNDPTQVWIDNHVDSFATTTLNLSWKPRGGIGESEFFINVQNLFNAKPPATAFFGAATIPGQFGGFAIGDDPIGRYLTAGFRVKF